MATEAGISSMEMTRTRKAKKKKILKMKNLQSRKDLMMDQQRMVVTLTMIIPVTKSPRVKMENWTLTSLKAKTGPTLNVRLPKMTKCLMMTDGVHPDLNTNLSIGRP